MLRKRSGSTYSLLEGSATPPPPPPPPPPPTKPRIRLLDDGGFAGEPTEFFLKDEEEEEVVEKKGGKEGTHAWIKKGARPPHSSLRKHLSQERGEEEGRLLVYFPICLCSFLFFFPPLPAARELRGGGKRYTTLRIRSSHRSGCSTAGARTVRPRDKGLKERSRKIRAFFPHPVTH